MSIPTAPSDNSEAPNASAQSPPAPQPPKRSSRRANTAERRATHNAVERARRETLNSRFLDLAALLPNLAAVRRPSKSAIVNSSISIIQTQRRNRVIAARELRLVKAETDAIRQELNQWRQRANLPPVEEPPRSADYISLLNVDEELEMQENPRAFEMHDGQFEDNDDYGDEEDEQLSPESAHPYGHGSHMSISGIPTSQKVPVTHHQQQQAHLAAQQQQQQQQQAAAFAQQKAAMVRASQQAQQQIAIPRMQSAQQHQHQQQQSMLANNHVNIYGDNFFTNDVYNGFSLPSSTPVENANMFNAQTWSQKAIQAAANTLVTPPGSAHGMNKSSLYANTANQAYLSNYAQQATSLGMFQTGLFGTGSLGGHGEDDNSSVGSSGHDFSTGSGSPSMNVLGTSPVEHPFSFAVGNTPPHSQPQSRRPSVNIPAHAYLASQSPVPKTGNSPVQVQVQVTGPQFAAMGLMM